MKKITILYSLVFFAQYTFGQTENQVTIGETFTINSQILNEERTYAVSLPHSYEGDHFYVNKRYPILILLDGERLFSLASSMIQSMSSGGIEQIPEMIVVGIYNTNRNRDFLPDYLAADSTQQTDFQDGADRFLQFINRELIPTIQQNYRTLDSKIIAGHSLGGLFVLNALLEKGGFDGYFAIDPSLWWQDESFLRYYQKLVEKEPLKGQIYVSQSNNPFNRGIESNRLGRAVQHFKKGLADFAASTQSAGSNGSQKALRYHFDFFENEDHFSIPLISFYEGLQFLFEGYKFPLHQIGETSIVQLETHYQNLANQFGDLKPPGKLLNQVGQFLLNSENEVEKAIELFRFNAKKYSNVTAPFNSLGAAYERAGNTALAIENYQKSLALDPDNERIRTRLEAIGNN